MIEEGVTNLTVGRLTVAAYAMGLGASREDADRISDEVCDTGRIIPSFRDITAEIAAKVKAASVEVELP